MGARQSCGKTCSTWASDCARDGHGNGDDFDDERPGGDPAGATFEETLEDLGSLDRQLLLFCGTSNLAAVRWLLRMGASIDACDANGTTCLHVACRSGTLAVVQEVMRRHALLQATDSAGWTPLHIAVLMGRREVVARLLQAGAQPAVRNCKGQAPLELCADSGTYEALRSFEAHQRESLGKPWSIGKDADASEDGAGSKLQYEPFFVPRQPVVRSPQFKKEFQQVGTAIFNRQPGFGLAFLVASGVARDYPVDMSTFLRRNKVDTRQVGSFLGEAFSLSHTIRLEFINSVVLQGTGVVSALKAVFHMLQLPDDLQKIDRLVRGVARIWWRQHDRLDKEQARHARGQDFGSNNSGPSPLRQDEPKGLDLKQHLSGPDALHQLMFSTVLLHWHMYPAGAGARKELPFLDWRQLNAGIEARGADVPEHVQLQIHALVASGFCAELELSGGRSSRGSLAAGGPDEGGGRGPGDASSSGRPDSLLLAPFAAYEGWAQIVGGGFPRPAGVSQQQVVTYGQISSIFSEVPNGGSGARRSPLAHVAGVGEGGRGTHMGRSAPFVEALPVAPKRDDFAWLSVCYTLLFFSASPQTGAPYAFVELPKVVVAGVNHDTNVITLVGAPDGSRHSGVPGPPDLPTAGGMAEAAGQASPDDSTPRVGCGIAIVLLLPDGRWQELSLKKLELRVASEVELLAWHSRLSAASQGRLSLPHGAVAHPVAAGPPPGPWASGPPQPARPSVPEPGGGVAPPESPGSPGGLGSDGGAPAEGGAA